VEVNCLDKVVVVVKGAKPVIFTGEKLKVSNSANSLVGSTTGLLWIEEEKSGKQLGVFAEWSYWKRIEDNELAMLRPLLVPPTKYPPTKAVIKEVRKAWRHGTLVILPAGWEIIYPYK